MLTMLLTTVRFNPTRKEPIINLASVRLCKCLSARFGADRAIYRTRPIPYRPPSSANHGNARSSSLQLFNGMHAVKMLSLNRVILKSMTVLQMWTSLMNARLRDFPMV